MKTHPDIKTSPAYDRIIALAKRLAKDEGSDCLYVWHLVAAIELIEEGFLTTHSRLLFFIRLYKSTLKVEKNDQIQIQAN